MKKAYLLHGFNVKDRGAGSVDKLFPYLVQAGYEPVELDYFRKGRIGVRLCNKGMANIIAQTVEPGSIAIGHSNGCAIIHMATHFGAGFSQVVYINPALNNDLVPGAQVGKFHVWHSPSDKAVRLAKFIPGSLWGNMGAVGYRGDDMRAANYNKEDDYAMSSDSHSDVFNDDLLAYFAPKMIAPVVAWAQ